MSKSDLPQDPPSYQESEGQAPGYSGHQGPNEYPDEKKQDYKQDQYQDQKQDQYQGKDTQQGPPPGTYTIPSDTYTVPPQKINIAYQEDGKNMRPGYKEYLEKDKERLAHGDFPKPREAFKRGAPLAPSHKGQSSGGFPGAHGPTYYNASNK